MAPYPTEELVLAQQLQQHRSLWGVDRNKGGSQGTKSQTCAAAEPVGGDGNPASGGEPAPHGICRKHLMVLAVVIALVSSAVLITTVLAVQRRERPSADPGPPAGPACPDGWVGHRGKCYYFSEGEGDWNSSQTHCSSLGASLAGIDTGQDMDFMLRHKGKFDHWIGLQRDPGQPWKWANGTEFNHP